MLLQFYYNNIKRTDYFTSHPYFDNFAWNTWILYETVIFAVPKAVNQFGFIKISVRDLLDIGARPTVGNMKIGNTCMARYGAE